MTPAQILEAKRREGLALLGFLVLQRDSVDEQIRILRSDLAAIDKTLRLFPAPAPPVKETDNAG